MRSKVDVGSADANLYVAFELGLCKVEGQLKSRRAIGDRSRLSSNGSGGRFAMAIEKAHDPWRDSVAWATVDWGEAISGCGAEKFFGTLRGRHVMDVIYVMLRDLSKIPGEAEARRSFAGNTWISIVVLKNRSRDRERVRAGARSNARNLRPQVQGRKIL